MTDSALNCRSQPPPLDFSTHRRQPQAHPEPEPRARECASQSPVLDLRIRREGDTDSPSPSGPTNRSMFEAYMANAGTPPSISPSRRSLRDRRSSDSTSDDSTHHIDRDDHLPPTQNPTLMTSTRPGALMPSAGTAFQPRIGSRGVIQGPDTPLYVATTAYDHESPSPAQMSPHFQISSHPDTTNPSSSFPENANTLVQFYRSFPPVPGKGHATSFSRVPLGPSAPSLYEQSNFYRSLASYPETLLRESFRAEENSDLEIRRRSPGLELKCSSKLTYKDELPSSFQDSEYLKMCNSQETDGSGSDTCEQGPFLGSPHDLDRKDEAYWERRRKNNEAAKRSRDARRAKEDEIAVKAAVLEKENICLKLNLAALKKEHQTLLLTLR